MVMLKRTIPSASPAPVLTKSLLTFFQPFAASHR
jgi:hypothetical protein